MTREEDTELAPYQPGRGGRHRRDLTARIERARSAKALYLVSIHCDWSTAPTRRGMVAFYYYRNPVGKNLALSIQEELNKIQPQPQKAAPGKYFLLEQPGINGVIVEVGFLSHPEEAALAPTGRLPRKGRLRHRPRYPAGAPDDRRSSFPSLVSALNPSAAGSTIVPHCKLRKFPLQLREKTGNPQRFPGGFQVFLAEARPHIIRSILRLRI